MERLDGHLFGEKNRCFGCGPTHPFGLRLDFRVEGDEVVTEFLPGDQHEGAPTLMHGGLLTALVDEVGAWTLIGLRGRFGFTGTLTSRFTRPVRVGKPILGRGRIVRETARVVHVEARVTQEGLDCVTSAMTFVILDRAGAERMIGGALPPAWEKFLREAPATDG